MIDSLSVILGVLVFEISKTKTLRNHCEISENTALCEVSHNQLQIKVPRRVSSTHLPYPFGVLVFEVLVFKVLLFETPYSYH